MEELNGLFEIMQEIVASRPESASTNVSEPQYYVASDVKYLLQTIGVGKNEVKTSNHKNTLYLK